MMSCDLLSHIFRLGFQNFMVVGRYSDGTPELHPHVRDNPALLTLIKISKRFLIAGFNAGKISF